MVYLTDVENRLLSSASDRDLSLYRFMNGRKHTIHVPPNDIESELCRDAFVDDVNGTALIKLRKIKPFKGLHYSKNIVLLIAAAKIDLEGERENIESFLKIHAYKEQLIINSSLGTDFKISTIEKSNIDKLAAKIENNEIINEYDIQQCISTITDIYDFFIVNVGITKIILNTEKQDNLSSYKELSTINTKAFKRIEIFSLTIFYCLLIYAAYLIAPRFITFVINNWDTLEPIAYLLDKFVLALLLILGVVLVTKVKSLKAKIKQVVFQMTFGLLGVNYANYQKVIKSLEKKSKL